MRTDRLLDVVKALEIVPDEQFTLRVWWEEGKKTEYLLWGLIPYKRTLFSRGCAIGHYVKQNPHIELKLSQSLLLMASYFDISPAELSHIIYANYYPYRDKNGEVSKSQVIGKILKMVEQAANKKSGYPMIEVIDVC